MKVAPLGRVWRTSRARSSHCWRVTAPLRSVTSGGVSPRVVGFGQFSAVAVDHPGQPAVLVVEVGVDRAAVFVIDDGDVPGQVPHPRAAAMRRDLPEHPTIGVIGVAHLTTPSASSTARPVPGHPVRTGERLRGPPSTSIRLPAWS